MYTKIETKDQETFEMLLVQYEAFRTGLQEVLARFGVAESDAPVEPPLFPNIPFRPEGVPQVVFRFTTSRKEENAEFSDDAAIEEVAHTMRGFIEEFLKGTGVTFELWFEFTLTNWCAGIG